MISGACGFCAKAFESEQHVHDANICLLDEYEGHPSFRKLVNDGYHVITF